MSLNNFKLTGKEIIIALSLVSGFFFQWYTLKMEIREQFLEAGFQKQTNEKHFELVDNNVKELSNKVNSLERKSQQILFMMYKEADKPKRIQLENEQ